MTCANLKPGDYCPEIDAKITTSQINIWKVADEDPDSEQARYVQLWKSKVGNAEPPTQRTRPFSSGNRGRKLSSSSLRKPLISLPTILVGSALKLILAGYGFTPGPTCPCTKRAQEMDDKGLDWCQNNVDLIVSWMKESAAEISLFNSILAKFAARSIVLQAIEQSILDYLEGVQKYSDSLTWAYGVTTVPSRFNGYLDTTLSSLKKVGFPDPQLFIDGCRESEVPTSLHKYKTTCRNETARTYGNWVLSMWELYIQNPNADRYAIFQDDFVSSKNLRLFLDSCPYPKNGYWNCYTFLQNEKKKPSDHTQGWYPSNQKGLSAIGLVFDRETLQKLLSSPSFVNRPTHTGKWWRLVDVQIGKAMREADVKEYVCNPSLVNHIGLKSSMGNSNYRANRSFNGEDFDLKELIGKVKHSYDQEVIISHAPKKSAVKNEVKTPTKATKISPPVKKVVKKNLNIDVVIPSHNYAHFLPECLNSVLESSITPDSIIVVDDSSDDNTQEVVGKYADQGVQYVRVEHRSTIKTRRTGFDLGKAEFVMFLDADDKLSNKYLETGINSFGESDGVANSDFQYFGQHNGTRTLNFDDHNIFYQNAIHAGSIYRRAALSLSQAMERETDDITHDDWTVAKEVIRHGWKVTKNPTPYLYRQHDESMIQTMKHDRLEPGGYYRAANLAREPITLFIPLSGRHYTWGPLSEFLDRQTRDGIRLILANTSNDKLFSHNVQQWIADSKYNDTRYIQLNVGQRSGMADEDRHDQTVCADVREIVARIYTRMRMEVTTEFVWIVEDDVIPPDDACDRLLQGMTFDSASISGSYQSRYHDQYDAQTLKFEHYKTPGEGVVKIGCNGFGCVILRKSILNQAPITNIADTSDYDVNFYKWLTRRPYRALIDWSVECDHLIKDRKDITQL